MYFREMRHLSVKMILQIAWRIFRKNTTSLGLLGVVSWMAMALLQYLPSVLGSLLSLAIIVFLPLFLPFAIFQVVQGRKIGLGTIGAGIKALWGRTLFLAVLMLLFGLITYFIPVLYRGFTSVYAKVLLVGLTGVVAVAAIMPIGLSLITIIVKDMGVLDAIGYSWNLTKKHWRKACSGTLALLATVGIGFVLIGAVLFVLGVSGHVLFGAGSHSAITAISGILAYGMRGIISVFSLLVVMVFFLLLEDMEDLAAGRAGEPGDAEKWLPGLDLNDLDDRDVSMTKEAVFAKVSAIKLTLTLLLISFFAGMVSGFIIHMAALILKKPLPMQNFVPIIITVVSVVMLWWVKTRFDGMRISVREFLTRVPDQFNWYKFFGSFLVLYFCLWGLSIGELFLQGLIVKGSQGIPGPEIFGSFSAMNAILAFLYGVIIGPVAEELFFRGIILHRLSLKWNTRKAMIVTSLLFSIMHFDVHLVTRFFLGLVLAVLYYRTKTLIVPIVLHACYNFMGFLMWVLFGMNIISKVPSVFLVLMPISMIGAGYYLIKNWPQKSWRLPYFADPGIVAFKDGAIETGDAAKQEQQGISG